MIMMMLKRQKRKAKKEAQCRGLVVQGKRREAGRRSRKNTSYPYC